MISKQEFYTQFNSGQNQYTYFIMAVDASGIAFVLNKIDDKIFTWQLLLAFIALASWAGSFVSGIIFQQSKNKILYLEYQNMDIREPDFPGISGNRSIIEKESKKLEEDAKKAQSKMHLTYNLLNLLMFLGMILFVAYQVIEMATKTNLPK